MFNMYQNSNEDNGFLPGKEAKPKHSVSNYAQSSTSIDIPASNNFYNQISPQYQEFYNDILSFTSGIHILFRMLQTADYICLYTDSSVLDTLNHSSIHSITDFAKDSVVDPINDPQFMAFLTSLSTSEPTSTSQPSQSSSTLLIPELEVAQSTIAAENKDEDEAQDTKDKKINNKCIKTIKKRTSKSNTRLGQCEHPKHSLYRQEKYILSTNGKAPADETFSSAFIQSIPRRGRPPKGSKSTEFIYSTSPLNNFAYDEPVVEPPYANATLPYYPMVELTVRPLPKRLEAVVGKTNIKVCLTCLKRSDMDPAYLQDVAYVGPQTLFKKKKQ
ncbi:hypothetical protein [Parasitella parasitica]|uniref:Uncharacterized protein n=1 Tax=Parasitella parasitica TaxID=35722 RepID=A0A0B7NNP4_9FUNG|nr:hypothetical protein [Parasitella parasitica]